ncbi:MAG: hypothetical protein ACFFCE_05730 [Promethearchaeota archaeon]
MSEEENYQNFQAFFCCKKLAELLWSGDFDFLPTRKKFIEDSKNVTVCPYCNKDLIPYMKRLEEKYDKK